MKLLFSAILFVLLVTGKTQLVDSTIHFNFDKSGEWDEWSNSESKAKINNGQYEISHLREDGSWCFWKYFQHPLDASFEMEIKLKHVGGVTNNGYGLVFGFKDWDNYNNFLISETGYFMVSTTIGGKYSEPQEWKETKLINKSSYNIIKIKTDEKYFYFYINNEEVLKLKNSKLNYQDRYCGIMIRKKMDIMADYFTFKSKLPRIKLVPNAIKGYQKENLGANVNCNVHDLCPIISPDGKTLYLNRSNHPENIGVESQDAWYCTLNPDGTWSKAKNMGKPINNTASNSVNSVSVDNTKLFLINNYKSDGSPDGPGLSLSNLTDKGWSIPTTVKIENFYNDHRYIFFNFSQDAKYLLMAVQRKDSKGDSDIYISFLNSDGSYTEPKNLGATINTSAGETTPFLASDLTTLYFSSDGHPGYGSNDIFVSKRLDDTWTNWSEPQNLGPEINENTWDAYFTIPASGDYAYMTKYNGTDNDIVKIKLSESAKPNPVALISGKVYNKKTNEPLGTKINYYDINNNEEVGTAQSNPVTGEYTIVLQYGKKYSFRADKEGFYAINDYVDLSEVSSYQEVKKDLFLVPLEVGQVVRLNNIFFDLNKADIKDESAEELNRLIEFMEKNKSLTIEIGGHTDDQGSDSYNATLSKQRAESVVNYLIGKGIDKSRLTHKGYGETKPVVKNDSDENRAFNRRVEFTITKQ